MHLFETVCNSREVKYDVTDADVVLNVTMSVLNPKFPQENME